MKIIDLSIPIEDGLPSDPPIQIPKIQYCNHKDTAEQMAGFFKGCTVEDLPEGTAGESSSCRCAPIPEPMWMPPTTITPP